MDQKHKHNLSILSASKFATSTSIGKMEHWSVTMILYSLAFFVIFYLSDQAWQGFSFFFFTSVLILFCGLIARRTMVWLLFILSKCSACIGGGLSFLCYIVKVVQNTCWSSR
ncbi:hypothetical protein BCR42DRAFT_91354 [Absidia repens]|uniref:Uncharacterized protein n=1 Tax=Absidia repens TaxID=90262 RepID=A0A1X2IYT1_9FUNG|nr:hypothetical protein BCR42DRAFT_91354 [Absidia repens]